MPGIELVGVMAEETSSGGSETPSGGVVEDYKSLALLEPEITNGNGKRVLSNGMSRGLRILKPEEVAQGRKTRWMELEITGKVKNLSPELWKLRHLTALFLNGNQLQRIPCEISSLSNLVILDLSHNRLRSLPTELGDMISLVHLYLNYNHLRVVPYELGKLFRLTTLGLHGNPLSTEISRIYHERDGTQKLLQFLLDHLAINTAPPPDRQWIMLNRLERDRPIATFSVMCYNVLCDKYASSSVYTYCPSWALNWEYRKKLIMQEIRNYESDIIALQEVETGQYKHLFKPELEQLGYAGIFSPKSRAKTMGAEEKKFVDGCALFWKVDKFELEEEKLIEFTQLAIAKAEGSDEMLNRVMTRDNIAIAAVLKIKDSVYGGNMHHVNPVENVVGTPVVVCAAHIHWDPEFCDVKLVQTMMLVQELSKMMEDVARQHRMNPAQVPLLTCGDLNSLPDSGVFEYLTRGKISQDHIDYKGFRGRKESQCLQKLSSTPESHVYTHPLKMESAYDTSIIPFSNYTLDFKGMIDYILTTPVSLYKVAVLGPVDQQWFSENKIIGCPHPHIPSDHLPLVAQYAIIPSHHQRIQYQTQHQAFQHYPGPVGRPT